MRLRPIFFLRLLVHVIHQRTQFLQPPVKPRKSAEHRKHAGPHNHLPRLAVIDHIHHARLLHLWLAARRIGEVTVVSGIDELPVLDAIRSALA